MYKNPYDCKKKDLSEMMYKKLRIDLGEANSDEVNNTIFGEIVHCYYSVNDPELPTDLEVRESNGNVKWLIISKIKRFSNI